MKTLHEILVPLGISAVQNLPNEGIDALSLSSQTVKPGTLFCAIRGTQQDGHDFIEDALQRGASAVLCEDERPELAGDSRVIRIPNLKEKLGLLANVYFPLKPNLQVLAVTGTNGKTSVTHFIAEALTLLGVESGVIGTLGASHFGTGDYSPTLTTPNRLDLGKLLFELPATVALEASSHALDQGRLTDLPIEVAVFTNLSHDHLDYHGSFEAYRWAKSRLFSWPGLKATVLNQDDPTSAFFRTVLRPTTRVLSYSLYDSHADIYLLSPPVIASEQKTELNIQTPEGRVSTEVSLLGDFNLSNVLATLGTLIHLGYRPKTLEEIFPVLHAPPGRMERIPLPNGALAVIDYAHTPDALEKVLSTLRPYTARLICVFGCGGDRDRTKRPKMAEIAEKYASTVIVTEDNSRFEEESQIFNDITQGFKGSSYQVIPSRADAIQTALMLSQQGDLILLAGKGHETYLDKKGIKIPFDERTLLRRKTRQID
jgi:UDP-N-acetylmuramoyl-L-alanyl-D-glutamate--2,6-diaminopimelate ligase